MELDNIKKIIIDNFGSLKEFNRKGIEAFNWIERHLAQLTNEQLHELIADCEVQMLIPSYMAKQRWISLHRSAKEELSKRPKLEPVK